jgi:hypothetical protein
MLATVYVLVSLRMRISTLFGFALAGAAIAYLVTSFERFQRFTTLGDSNMVRDRIAMSVNMSFFDILKSYPLGAGLASAWGTTIPSFLRNDPNIHRQLGIENEYGRIVVEEGIIGLVLWVSLFLSSLFGRQRLREASPVAAAYMHAIGIVMCLTGAMGAGLLYATPLAPMFFVIIGMRLANPVSARATRPLGRVREQTRGLPRRRPASGELVLPQVSR